MVAVGRSAAAGLAKMWEAQETNREPIWRIRTYPDGIEVRDSNYEKDIIEVGKLVLI